MTGFNSGAIDPALLSGGGGAISPAQLLNNPTHNNTTNPSTTTTAAAAATSSSSTIAGATTSVLNSSSAPNLSLHPFTNTSLNQIGSTINNNPSSFTSTNLNSTNNNNQTQLRGSTPIGQSLLNQINGASSSTAATTTTTTTSINPNTTAVFNNAGQTATGATTPTTIDPFMANGMTLKEHEMHQKDQELAQFLLKMDEYKPVIPDEVANYYLQKVGFECTDVRLKRLLVLACQKFVSDIAQDAFAYASTRTGQAPGGRQGQMVSHSNSAGTTGSSAIGGGTQNGFQSGSNLKKDRTRTVLTQEDLAQALAEYGINAGRAPYYL